MKITKIEPVILRLPKATEAVDGTQDDLLISIETDRGLYGWDDSSSDVARAMVEAPTSHRRNTWTGGKSCWVAIHLILKRLRRGASE
jgi:hypothetical protein